MSQVRVSHLTFAYEGSFENVFTDLSLSFDTDWRLGLVGRNGRGKTTLLRLLSGLLPHGGAISASVRFDCFPFPVPRPERDTLEVLESLAPEVMERYRRQRRLMRSLLCVAAVAVVIGCVLYCIYLEHKWFDVEVTREETIIIYETEEDQK